MTKVEHIEWPEAPTIGTVIADVARMRRFMLSEISYGALHDDFSLGRFGASLRREGYRGITHATFQAPDKNSELPRAYMRNAVYVHD